MKDLRTEISQRLQQMTKTISQNKLAIQADISSATLNHMINGKWELISEEMWRKVQTNLGIVPSWKTGKTRNYVGILKLLAYAQRNHDSVAISYDAGAGKSHSYKDFAKTNSNVIYIECKNYWTKKNYVANLCQASGLKSNGTTIQLIERLMAHLKTLKNPLIIIDQADKLKDPSLDLFMDFYNDLHGQCGFLLSGVPALEKRILRGVNYEKIGYAELYSRIGRKFIKLQKLTINDVKVICEANGVTNEEYIHYCFNNSEGDLRRVKADIEKYFELNKKAA